jgi:phosphoribosyl-AMP cyclohydrolase
MSNIHLSISLLEERLSNSEDGLIDEDVVAVKNATKLADELFSSVNVVTMPTASINEDQGLMLQWGDSRSPTAALVSIYQDGHVDYFVRTPKRKGSRSGTIRELISVIAEDLSGIV